MQRVQKMIKKLCQESQTKNSKKSLKDYAHHQLNPNQRPSRGPSPASRLGALPGTASRDLTTALYEATRRQQQ